MLRPSQNLSSRSNHLSKGFTLRLRQVMGVCFISYFFIGLSACSPAKDPAAILLNAQTAQPEDEHLAEIYQRSCKTCHTLAETTAPLVGDGEAWAPRIDKGMGVLVDHVINGFGGMPPYGLCMDCEVHEFEQLIDFMAKDTSSHPL